MNIDTLRNKVISHTGPSPYGVSCKFIRLDDDWGIKVYNSSTERDRAVSRQAKLYEHGYAPKVGIVFDVPSTFRSYYCYVTQCAVPLIEGDAKYARDYYTIATKYRKENPAVSDEITELCKNMEAVEGRPYSDIHYANFGRLDGKLVCLDFGN
jgi:hypothetical protein